MRTGGLRVGQNSEQGPGGLRSGLGGTGTFLGHPAHLLCQQQTEQGAEGLPWSGQASDWASGAEKGAGRARSLPLGCLPGLAGEQGRLHRGDRSGRGSDGVSKV